MNKVLQAAMIALGIITSHGCTQHIPQEQKTIPTRKKEVAAYIYSNIISGAEIDPFRKSIYVSTPNANYEATAIQQGLTSILQIRQFPRNSTQTQYFFENISVDNSLDQAIMTSFSDDGFEKSNVSPGTAKILYNLALHHINNYVQKNKEHMMTRIQTK
jgi:hypothetical protein